MYGIGTKNLHQVILVLAILPACGKDSPSSPKPPEPPPPAPSEATRIEVIPPSHRLNAVGQTVQLTARVYDQHNAPMNNATVAWSSNNPSVATVSAQGLVTAVKNGVARITATSGGVSSGIDVTVMQEAGSIVIEPGEATLMSLGATVQLAAAVLDGQGQPVSGAVVTRQSSDEQVATVSAQGLVTAVKNGVARITATSGGVSSGIDVTVMQEAGSIVIEPGEATLMSLGATVQLAAAVLDGQGQPVSGAVVTWQSSDEQVATVSAQGLVTAVKNGVARITATSGGVSSGIDVTVIAETVQVSIPDNNLRAIIEDRLGKTPGSPVYRHEMETLTQLDARYVYNDRIYTTIRSLEGIQFASNLEELQVSRQDVDYIVPLDLSPLSTLIKLKRLNIAAVNNTESPSPLDLSPLEGLQNLIRLNTGANHTPDISPLASLTNLQWLDISRNRISNVTALSSLENLSHLLSYDNRIVDVSPLKELSRLREVNLSQNNINDIEPLAANSGLDEGDVVDVRLNNLNVESILTHIPALTNRGVVVLFDEVVDFTDPFIFKNNVFVLPIAEKLNSNPPIKNMAVRFYEYFVDEFDFLMFVPNISSTEGLGPAFYVSVMNDVEGIGKQSYTRDNWGTTGKLQGVVKFGGFSLNDISELGMSVISYGPSLHEIMHRWANFIIPSTTGPHWGLSSANGILGGFDIDDLVDNGNGRFSAGDFAPAGWATNLKPYSPIELYLAGFVGAEEVPELWVAENGKMLRDETGIIVRDENGYEVFTADRMVKYTIEDIIETNGQRVPDVSNAQKDFRAAVILLVDQEHPPTREVLEILSRDVSWFSYIGDDGDSETFNFHEATGGRGTIVMDGLSGFTSSDVSVSILHGMD